MQGELSLACWRVDHESLPFQANYSTSTVHVIDACTKIKNRSFPDNEIRSFHIMAIISVSYAY